MHYITTGLLLTYSLLAAQQYDLNPPFDKCRFSTDGKLALVYEFKDGYIASGKVSLLGFYQLGQNNTYDTVALLNDSVYFVTDIPYTDTFKILKAARLKDFIDQHKLTITGIDRSGDLTVHIDSSFIRRGLPLINGIPDTMCVESNFYNFYLTYMLPEKEIYRDTIFSSNTTAGDLLDILQQTEKLAVFNEDSSFRGYKFYGFKIFCDENLKSVFIRTKHTYTQYQTKTYRDQVVTIDPETGQEEITETAWSGWGCYGTHIRKLIKTKP